MPVHLSFPPYFYFRLWCKRQSGVVYRRFWATGTSGPLVYPMLRGHSPVCIVGVLWPKGWVDQDSTWYGACRLDPGDIVADGDGRRREGVRQIFTARRNARIASAVLDTAIPSVFPSVCPSVCLSVTRRYCVKTTARSTVQFPPSDSKMCLVL